MVLWWFQGGRERVHREQMFFQFRQPKLNAIIFLHNLYLIWRLSDIFASLIKIETALAILGIFCLEVWLVNARQSMLENFVFYITYILR